MLTLDHTNKSTTKAAANQAFGKRCKTMPSSAHVLQTKISINAPNDVYEQEADRVAYQVMQGDAPAVQTSLSILSLQRLCDECEEEQKGLQRHELNLEDEKDEPFLNEVVPAGQEELQRYVSALGNSGQSLPSEVRSFFEPRFGYDFSNVKIHTDDAAARSAQSVNALAYTTGNHIVFNGGQYSPEKATGQQLLAHELTHVVQQEGRSMSAQAKFIQRTGSCPEENPRIPHKLLVKGSKHSDVREVQRKLTLFSENEVLAGRPALPEAPLVDDCVYGKKTAAAVLEFQKRKFPDASEEWDGKVGDHTWAEIDKIGAVLPPPGTIPGTTPPGTTPPGTTPPPAATITSETVVSSPGPRTRTTIGIGEEVRLRHSAGTPATAWTRTAGTLLPDIGPEVLLRAPDTAQTVTVTADGATIDFSVISPTGVHMDRFPGTGVRHKEGRPDVGIETQPFLLPDTVNFNRVIYQEVDVPGIPSPGGVYSCNPGLNGHCRHGGSGGCGDLFMTDIVEAGKGTKSIAADCVYSGDCGTNSFFGFSPGTLTFLIPYEFKVGAGPFHPFPAPVTQVHALGPDGSTLTADKAGAHGETVVGNPTVVIGDCGG